MSKLSREELTEEIIGSKKRIKELEKQIHRLNIIHGLESIPEEWKITPKRIKRLRDATGWSLENARRELIKNFGDVLDVECY